MAEIGLDLAGTKVLVVGDVMLDRYWHGDVDRVSPEAPVQVVLMQREETRLGGAGNVALNVSSLGGEACLLAVTGRDEAGTQLKTLLKKSRICDHLHMDDDAPTTVKLRINGRAQQLLRVDFEQSPGQSALGQLERGFEQQSAACDVIILSDYGKGGLTNICAMIERARGLDVAVLVDPKGDDYSPYKGASVITPNRAELQMVIGRWRDEADLLERVSRLRKELEIGAVLLTRSEDGMSLFDDEGVLSVPAQAREVFDVTGAGDTVIATLATLLGAGLSLREALPHTNRAGGIVVGKFGAAPVTFKELFA